METASYLLFMILALSATTALSVGTTTGTNTTRKGYTYEYGYAYNIGLNSKICIECDEISFPWVPDTNFTYQAWIKPHILSSDRTQQVVGNAYYNEGFFNHGIVIEGNYTGLRAGSFTKKALDNSPRYDLSDHLFKWTHVTASFETNSTTQTVRLYIDGESAGTTYDVGILKKIESAVMVGSSSGDFHYTGLADEIRLFNHVLTDEEVNDTWSRSLTQEELDSGDVLFYFNADGERYNEPKDKSKYHRPCGWVTDPKSMSLANRSSVVANCKGNFTSDMISFCVPYEADFGYCGDDIVMGDEECDNGEGCVDCKCAEGYTAHGLPYCKKLIDGLITMKCEKSTAIGMCNDAMNSNKCDCKCFKETGIDCLLKQNCNSDTINSGLYTTWAYCNNICNDSDVCYDIIPDLCARYSTADECMNSSLADCTWCGTSCMSMSTTCPPAMGNGIIEANEECDDGNLIDGDGCSSDGLFEPGFECEILDGTTSCTPMSKKGDSDKGLTIGLSVTAVFIVIIVVVVLLILFFLYKSKNEKLHQQSVTGTAELTTLGDGIALDIDDEEGFDSSKSTLVDVKDFPLLVEGFEADFGFNLGARAPIEKEFSQKFTLTNNTQKKMSWKIFTANSEKYTFCIFPGTGTLAKGESCEVDVRLTVHCTTVVKAQLPICAWKPTKKEEDEAMEHIYIDVNVESKLSTRLDPDEIRLVQPPIGEGSFGTVFRGFYKDQEVAAKVLKNQVWGEKIEEFFHEIKVMEELRSPFIVNFVGAVVFPGKMCLVSEYIPLGSLSTKVKNEQLSYLVKLRMVLDCAKGMWYLHGCRIMHRDLKPDNVLVMTLDETAPVCCKISDFGSTREIGDEISKSYTRGVGTPAYMAPEVLEDEGYSKAADVYSFSILMHEIYTEKEPFSEFGFKKPWHMSEHVIKGGRMSIPDACPSDYGALINKCWAQDPNERPSFKEIVTVLDDMFIPLIKEAHPGIEFESVKDKEVEVFDSLADIVPEPTISATGTASLSRSGTIRKGGEAGLVDKRNKTTAGGMKKTKGSPFSSGPKSTDSGSSKKLLSSSNGSKK